MRLGVVILAGGNGTRIGSKKAFLTINEKPLLFYVYSVAQKITDDITIVLNDNDKTNPLLNFVKASTRITSDIICGYGPLMGIYSGLKQTKADYVLILPCDTPLIREQVLEKIVSSVNGYKAVIPRWQNGLIEPLHGVYHVPNSISEIEILIKNGEKNVKNLILKLNPVHFISIESLKEFDQELDSFYNINYKLDLDEAKNRLNNQLLQK
jgi:molybdopterin-guanine dinucleotide biosynthesis protein A